MNLCSDIFSIEKGIYFYIGLTASSTVGQNLTFIVNFQVNLKASWILWFYLM